MKIGVIGLGGIAQKAYMPTYASNRHLGEFIFATRNEETKEMLKAKYGFSTMVSTVDELIEMDIDACFIHIATSVHYETAKACLEKGIHVYMDKPISESLAEVKELLQLAADNNCVFMSGFNRRFAPMIDELKNLPNKRVIQVQKNVPALQWTVDFSIYDLFLHVVDTAVYLLEEDIQVASSRITAKDGFLETAFLHLTTPSASAIVSMDLNSGASTEIYQATSPEKTLVLNNLTDLDIYTAAGSQKKGFGNWETTLYKRGFEQMVQAFIKACESGDPSELRQKNVLLTHEICTQMIKDFENQ